MSLSRTLNLSHVARTVITQTVGRWLLTADDWVRSLANSCDIFVGQSGTRTRSSSEYGGFLLSASHYQRPVLDCILIPLFV